MRTAASRACILLTLGALVVGGAGAAPDASQARSDEDRRILLEFQQRVERYVALHRQLEGPVPAPQVSTSPAEIRAAVDGLAGKIRAARAGARQGDVLTPEIQQLFRRIIRDWLAGRNPADLLGPPDDEDTPPGVLLVAEVNGRYPAEAALPPTPPGLLRVLPRLPDELQYRFMDRALILWDMHANVIVDFIPGAL